MSKWKKMENGWPEVGDYVIIALFNGEVEIGYIQRGPTGAYYFSEAYGDDFLVNSEGVTHWMPLPSHPKEVVARKKPVDNEPCMACGGLGRIETFEDRTARTFKGCHACTPVTFK